MKNTFRTSLLLAAAGLALSGCNAINRLSEVGEAPKTSKITDPTQNPLYRPVSLPMPAPKTTSTNPNSLWRPGARAFFKDNRAGEVGDILTVKVSISDKGTLNNKTTEARDNNETTDALTLLGYETQLSRLFPSAANAANLGAMGSTHAVTGDGKIDRKEEISVTMAAVIIQVLPNGNLVLAGKQEIRVNNEMRELTVSGIIRPSDIDSTNSITYEKIAEARITYGGRGTLSDLQQPRYGQQLFDIIFPF
ncbi:MAG: flagellar basal body L-ring protein FlgH [Alphaproteobacteria bacterium]|nr:flagellar basal body L-ring protein FlgH [Alphaproteobacteria bacterium]